MSDQNASRNSARWSILRDTLLRRGSATRNHSEVSRRPTGRFGLLSVETLTSTEEKDWELLQYRLPQPSTSITLRQRREEAFDLKDFKVCNENKIDNTGLVCMWPAEEVLTYYCIAHAEAFRGCRVLELGAGAGLAGLALAATGMAAEVVLTDGNPTVVEVLRDNIRRNQGSFTHTNVHAEMLHWAHYDGRLGEFDVVIAADCTFFKDFHASLVEILQHTLHPRGMVFMFNPARHGSLDRFADLVRQVGFETLLEEEYDGIVWDRHQRLSAAAGTSREAWPAYNVETCFPLLLQIRWPSKPRNWLKYGVMISCLLYLGPRIWVSVVENLQVKRKERRNSTSTEVLAVNTIHEDFNVDMDG